MLGFYRLGGVFPGRHLCRYRQFLAKKLILGRSGVRKMYEEGDGVSLGEQVLSSSIEPFYPAVSFVCPKGQSGERGLFYIECLPCSPSNIPRCYFCTSWPYSWSLRSSALQERIVLGDFDATKLSRVNASVFRLSKPVEKRSEYPATSTWSYLMLCFAWFCKTLSHSYHVSQTLQYYQQPETNVFGCRIVLSTLHLKHSVTGMTSLASYITRGLGILPPFPGFPCLIMCVG